MYHCHVHFYLTGHYGRILEIIQEMSPLEHFTHEFSVSDRPKEALASKADVIFAGLQDGDCLPAKKRGLKSLCWQRRGRCPFLRSLCR